MHAQKTQLVQEYISDPSDAIRVFNEARVDRIPIVLVPANRWWCSFFYTVPSGTSAIVHHCGKDAYPGELAPAGLQFLKPYWNHVAYCVTQQSCTYNAPVKSCPTIDNVMVDCELTLVFSIGPDPEEVKNFVYKLGAYKFNEFLAAETEEAIRQLVRATPLEEIYELRGSSSEHVANVLRVLNEKFQPFGVTFTKAAITDVHLGDELRRILQGTTEFRTKIRELDKEHDHNLKVIGYDFDQKHKEMERMYERRIQDVQAETRVVIVNRERDVVNYQSKMEVAITNSQENASVQRTRAEADLQVTTLKAEQENAEVLARVEAEAESRKIKVMQDCKNAIAEAEHHVHVSEKEAEALLAHANAEKAAANQLKAIREHNLIMAKHEVVESIAKQAKLVISGQSGDHLIGALLKESVIEDMTLPNIR